MDWYKERPNYILDSEYSDVVSLGIIKIRALTARLEKIPTEQQLKRYIHHNTLKAVHKTLQDEGKTLSRMVEDVIKTIDKQLVKRHSDKTRMQGLRVIARNVANDSQTCSEVDKTRLDKIREDKINTYSPTDDCCFFNDNDFKNIWKEFIQVRNKKRCSNSDRAIKKQINRLIKFSNGNKIIAMKIVERAADKGWNELYELTEKTEKYNFDTGEEQVIDV